MTVVWFQQITSPNAVGTKGYNLSVMTQSGLPVPPGFCVPVDAMNSMSAAEFEDAFVRLPAKSVAVRSSAVGEDAGNASFAGIHLTQLNVRTAVQAWEALQEVRASGFAPAAQVYRRRLGISGFPQMAVVVQEFIAADAAGVLFMRDPIDRSDRVVIEACWGLGEGVIAGTVMPDRWTLTPGGALLSEEIADKDTAVVADTDGIIEIEVAESHRRLPCLSPDERAELLRLALECGNLFGEPQDVEWAIALGKVWILQSRPITGRGSTPGTIDQYSS